jgi:hypothetical protein
LELQFGAGTSVRASYIGSHTVEQVYGAPANIPFPSTVPFTQSRRPLTQFGQIAAYQTGADASYNGLTLQFQHPTHIGIYINSSYTWAKDLGISGETSTVSGAESPVILNPFNRQLDYGPVMWAPVHQSVTVINFPVPEGRHWKFFPALPPLANAVFSGWNFSSIFIARSGDHLTPTYSGYDATGTGILSGRPDLVGDPNLSQPSASRWFNPAAFTFPGASLANPLTPPAGPIGRFSTAGVGIIAGPGGWQEDTDRRGATGLRHPQSSRGIRGPGGW